MARTQELDAPDSDTQVTELPNGQPTVLFFDDIPTISRNRESATSGKYTSAVNALHSNPGSWGLIVGPIAAAASVAANLNSGRAAGVDPEVYEFSARNLTSEQATAYGLPTTNEVTEKGEPIQGYVFGRVMNDEQKVARTETRAKRTEAGQRAAAARAANAAAPA